MVLTSAVIGPRSLHASNWATPSCDVLQVKDAGNSGTFSIDLGCIKGIRLRRFSLTAAVFVVVRSVSC